MTDLSTADTFPLGDRVVNRLGYGAMQLAGPSVRAAQGSRRRHRRLAHRR